jgi:hypothetical protein
MLSSSIQTAMVESFTIFTKRYISIVPIDIRVNTFCDHLIDTYIDENVTFSPYLWSLCDISGKRTTNTCEVFHSAFGKYFYFL